MADYKIKLGIDFDDGELKNVKKQLTNLTDNTHRIRIDIDNSRLLKQIDHAKKELKELNSTKGNQPSLTVNTQSLEKSLSRVADVIDEVRKSLGSIDNKSGMQSLVASVNQIATALGRAEDESDNLVKSLSALSKKDFSFNFNVKTGNTNPVKAMTDYGREARKNSIPALEEQVVYLHKLFGGWEKADAELKKYLLKSKQLKGLNEYTRIQDDMGNASSLSKQMDALQDYIKYTKKIASEKGIDLSGFNAEFSKSAKDIVDDTIKIQTGAKQTEEELDKLENKLKNVFGGGIDAESLSISLTPIIEDLREIRETIQELSKGFSLGGLTQSFDRLSGSIENLLKNAEKVKGVLGSSTSNASVETGSVSGTRIKAEDIVPDSSGVVQAAQQVGTKIGDTIEQSVKQNINVDDVIDQEVLGLMETFSITGDKGSKAFKEIRQALIECRSELQRLKTLNPSNDEEAFDTSGAFNKVSDAIANQIREVNSLGDEYIKLAKYIDNIEDVELAKYMTNFNDPKKGNKVRVPDFIKQEQGDDYRSTRGQLGIAFNTEKGISFASFIEDLNHELGIAIDLTNGEEKAYEELVDKLRLGREQLESQKKSQNYLQANASTDEILAQNYINKNEIRDVAESSIDYINAAEAAEKAFAQASTQSTNVVVQNEERVQQAKRETANIIQSVSKQTSLVRGNVDFEQVFNSGNQSAKEAQKYFEALLKEEKAVVSVKENFDKSLGNSGELKSFTVDIQRATGEVEKLHYAMSSADNDNRFLYQGASVSDKNIDKQTEARIKSADKLQTKLEEIKTKYKDMGSAKPIKDSDHINALDRQYRKVKKAIDNVRNADNTMSASAISNAEKQKSILENMVREYRNAETIATSLRSKDIGTVKATYGSDLDVLIQKMKDAGVYTSGFEKGAENLRTVLADATDPSGLVSFLNGFDKLEAGYKRVAQTAKSLTQTKLYGQKASGIESDIKGWQRINPEINKFEAEIDGAKVSVQSLLNELSQVKTKSDFQIAEGNFKAFEKAAKGAGIALTETDADFNRLKSLAKEINSIEFKIAGLDASKNEAEINELTISLNRLHKEYENLFATTSKNLSGSQVSQLDDIFEKAGDKLRQLDAQIADTKAKLAKGIKADIELGNFDNEIDAMRVKFNSLSDANDELRRSYKATNDAYTAMMNAAKANTGDEVADRERLIQAEKEYAAALEKTNNLIKQQARADKIANDAKKLQDNRDKFQAKIDSWMANNSAATKRFGDKLLDLRAKAEKADQVQLNHLEAELYKIDKVADKDGLKMMSFGDSIKSKFKQYMAYFSVAEVFMYAEQALRSMFEQVKLIDSAMTELKKVTNETDAVYNQFLSNAASRAKEIGTTIDGLVSSAADFARLGYNISDSTELAEVANIYAVVGDEIDSVETATKSLISTMTAFGIEASDSMSIVDKFNAVGNNFAISSGGIGDALERSASSMAAANNSLDETIALITAANTVVQDADAVGRLMPT